ncbi:MAG: YjgN family protein [Pseudomonadota bacterium]
MSDPIGAGVPGFGSGAAAPLDIPQPPPIPTASVDRPTTTGVPEPIDITWRGSPWALTGLSFLNTLLSILTLGIYSFWGKTEVRKRIWSAVRINGEPLVYTGTGKELFLGFLIIFGVFLLPSILILIAASLTFGENSLITIAIQIVVYLIIFVLFGLAVWRARRYRLSRTTWRGIRGSLDGSGWGYTWTYIWTTLLIFATLGWIIPYRTHALYKQMTGAQYFGSGRFGYDGDVGDIYARFAGIFFGGLIVVGALGYLATLLSGFDFTVMSDPERLAGIEDDPELAAQLGIFIFGVLFIYIVGLGVLQVLYFTAITNYITRQTTFDGARFDLRLSLGGMLWIFLSNLVIMIVSLTILQPVALARISKYVIDRLSVTGAVDVDGIIQNATALSRTGEGMAGAFDIDGF